MRTFIALPLDDQLRVRVAGFLAKWRQLDHELKWVNPSLLHVTLRFLGEVDRSLLSTLEQVLEETGREVEPFDISLKGAGVFPSLSRPQVFWLGLSSAERLPALASHLDSRLAEVGWGDREEPFSAHLTVARVRRGSRPSPAFLSLWQRLMDGSEEGPAGAWRADRLVLYESRLHPGGPEYLPLAQAKLDGSSGS
ncbi:MAG: RNA 2',3'-cyclic phosphodiesterase [Limnochordales bacterium]|nr:RNA 2',3'-cyclic phosphodiesterase [Limnochordales bacterium]